MLHNPSNLNTSHESSRLNTASIPTSSKSSEAPQKFYSRRSFLTSLAAAGVLFSTVVLTACAQQNDGRTSAGSQAAADEGSAAAGSTAGSMDAASSSSTSNTSLEGTAEDKDARVITAVAPDDPFGKGTHHAALTIKDYGTIKLVLDADSAPVSVSNFCRLANNGFYNGLTFHRIIEGFMMQGGDPKGDGTGGADRMIVGEFSANGINNPLLLTRGALAMARAQDNNSASSQFFIMQAYQESLDGQYAAFGHVSEGMDVVDKVCSAAQPTDNNGSIAPADQPIIEKLTIDD